MKKAIRMLSAVALLSGFAVAFTLGSTVPGKVVKDPKLLTQITGSGCAGIAPQSCQTTGGECDACSASHTGKQTGALGDTKDCSSDDGWTCGSCHGVKKCAT